MISSYNESPRRAGALRRARWGAIPGQLNDKDAGISIVGWRHKISVSLPPFESMKLFSMNLRLIY